MFFYMKFERDVIAHFNHVSQQIVTEIQLKKVSQTFPALLRVFQFFLMTLLKMFSPACKRKGKLIPCKKIGLKRPNYPHQGLF